MKLDGSAAGCTPRRIGSGLGKPGPDFFLRGTEDRRSRQSAVAFAFKAQFGIMLDRTKHAHFREQHWPAIFGGINEHFNGKSPFRRVTLKVWQRLDVIGGVAQSSRWRSAWKRNGLVERTVPTHDLSQPQGELPIRTGVAIDKVSKRFRNIVTIDIATALDFEGDIF